jgi:hypothetical protein
MTTPRTGIVEPWTALGTELVVDTHAVKCWIETVPPHESRPLHTHLFPWITVVLSGAAGSSLGPDGSVLTRSELKAGQVVFNGPDRLPLCHRVYNTSNSTLVMVAIELRGDPAVKPAELEI